MSELQPIEIDPAMEAYLNQPLINPFREPDKLDAILHAEMARMRHQRRMDEIVDMDVREWATAL